MGAPLHGINGLIYISGIELTGANSWSLNIDQDTEETLQFGERWKSQLVGGRGYSGSIGAYQHLDSKVIHSAAVKGANVSFIIYPDKTVLGSYYYGNAVFGLASGGTTTSSVNRDGDFVGDGALGTIGFPAA